MNLRDTTRDIISLVEQQTGYPVQVIDDPDLATTAVVHIARANSMALERIAQWPDAQHPVG